MSCRFKFKNFKQGFTLVEMMVVVAIFIITTGIVLSNFGGFREKSSLDLLAREMALIIRQAQVYGTATKVAAGGANSFPSYGIYADWGNDYFIMFADKNGNERYDAGEDVEKFVFYGGVTIKGLAGWQWNSARGDYDSRTFVVGSRGSASAKPLGVYFKRPETEAEFFTSVGGGAFNTSSFSYVTITIRDRKNQERRIAIWRTGHIYVETTVGTNTTQS